MKLEQQLEQAQRDTDKAVDDIFINQAIHRNTYSDNTSKRSHIKGIEAAEAYVKSKISTMYRKGN